jgi:hypothetical protein
VLAASASSIRPIAANRRAKLSRFEARSDRDHSIRQPCDSATSSMLPMASLPNWMRSAPNMSSGCLSCMTLSSGASGRPRTTSSLRSSTAVFAHSRLESGRASATLVRVAVGVAGSRTRHSSACTSGPGASNPGATSRAATATVVGCFPSIRVSSSPTRSPTPGCAAARAQMLTHRVASCPSTWGARISAIEVRTGSAIRVPIRCSASRSGSNWPNAYGRAAG